MNVFLYLILAAAITGQTSVAIVTSDQPTAIVTDTTAIFWFPVQGTDTTWQFGGAPESFSASVQFPLLDRNYQLSFGSPHPERGPGTYMEIFEKGGDSLLLLDDLAHTSWVISGEVTTIPLATGFTLRLDDREWVTLLAGAHPDSLEMRLDFNLAEVWAHDPGNQANNANRFTQTVKVEYRLSEATARNARIEYRTRYESEQRFLAKTFAPRRPRQILICFANDKNAKFFDLSGRPISDDKMELVSRAYLDAISSTRMQSFALCGEHLFFTNVSLFDLAASSGVTTTLMEGIEGAHAGHYYVDVSIDPTGRYLAVVGSNGMDWGFFWDIDHKRALAELYIPVVPGQVMEMTFGLWPTSVLLKKGHRIRVAIAGADRETFARLPAEGTPTIAVERNARRFSFIELPVFDRP